MNVALQRFEDWPSRLSAAVEAARTTPFVWGVSDCCLFAADCVLAMTDVDLAAEYRGRYRSKRGAYATLKRRFGGGVEAAARHALDAPLPSALMAQRGDVVLVDTAEGPALGVCLGRHCGCRGRTETVFVPLANARLAWRV